MKIKDTEELKKKERKQGFTNKSRSDLHLRENTHRHTHSRETTLGNNKDFNRFFQGNRTIFNKITL